MDEPKTKIETRPDVEQDTCYWGHGLIGGDCPICEWEAYDAEWISLEYGGEA